MLEAGIVLLVNADTAVAALCPSGGGFIATLPENQALPSWSWRTISDHGDYALAGEKGFRMQRLQIDCYGSVGGDALDLAAAINKVLSGYRGTLGDADSTQVDAIFESDSMTFFDDASRDYRKMLEYEVQYYR